MSISSLLEVAEGTCGDRVALGPRDGGLTFSGLRARARGGASLLRESGARHVVYLGVNGPAFSAAMFASAAAGLPIVPLNYRLADPELRGLLEEVDRPLVLADPDMLARLAPSGAPVISSVDWMEQAENATRSELVEYPDDAVAVVLFTSGTTSRPKAVLLRHSNLVAYTLQTVEFLGAGPEDCALVSVPPYHVAGVASVLSNIYSGRRVVHLPVFSPDRWLDLARTEGVTSAMVVPTMLARLVEHLGDEPAELPRLQTIAYGGARMSPAVLERAMMRFRSTGFVNAYGLTETSSTIAVLGPADHRAASESTDEAVRARLASVGRAVPGVELEVRGEDGKVLPPGQFGELWVRGSQVSGEYAGTGVVLDADGWFHTRDRAMLDREGYLFIEGRTDDTIIRGAENVAPASIEDVLMLHPAVRDAAVVGVPDDEWGERIAAVVVPHPGAEIVLDELRAFARERLRSSRTPDQVSVWNELPYTSTGKLLRREVITKLVGAPAA